MRKPTLFKYNKQVEEVVNLLEHISNDPSDLILPYFVRLQIIFEDVHRVFRYDNPECRESEPMDPIRIHEMVQRFKRELKEVKDAFPEDVRNNCKPTVLSLIVQRLRISQGLFSQNA